jgi:hypothetical protein
MEARHYWTIGHHRIAALKMTKGFSGRTITLITDQEYMDLEACLQERNFI